MHTDARTLPDHTTIEGDLCIVGAGPAGISIAMEWNNTPYKVILLEGGGFDYDEQVQQLYAGRETGQHYYPLESTRLHYFGGTSNHWAGWCSPFEPLDFEKRAWVPHSGWPIKRSDLDPFYARAHPILDLGPYEYDVAYWQKKDPALRSLLPDNPTLLPDHPMVWNKVWQFSPPTRFGKKYGAAIKQSQNIHLYTYANLTDITANDPVTAIESVTVKNLAGRQHTVKAKRYVLACCAIQNARILLASHRQAPKGLGNDHDLVGRYFMEHLEIKSAWLYLPAPDPLKLYVVDFGVTKMRCELAISREMQEKYQILSGTSSLTPFNQAKGETPAIQAWSDADPRKSAEKFYHSFPPVEKGPQGANKYMMSTRVEQAPNPNSRITLDTERDALGMPHAMLNWVLTPLEKRSIRTIYELIGRQLGAAGAGRVQLMEYLRDPNDNSWPDFTGGGWHHMGTTRMSDDPRTGVVDADCKVHGIANLFIAGSACYVTAAAPNPTLTLVALSLRLSDHLKRTIS